MIEYAFDPFYTGANEEDPYPVYRRLRDETPFYHDDRWGLWVISRFDDVQNALRDWRTFSQEPDVDIDGFMEDLLEPDGNILVMDPPRHDELRKLVQGTNIFSPKAIKDMEPRSRGSLTTWWTASPMPAPSTPSRTSATRSRSRWAPS